MPTGDSATLFWALVTLAATFGVGGYQLTGRKSRNLWALCAGFLVLALVLGFGIPNWTARYAAAALQAVWIAYPLLTIAAVSLLIRGHRTPAAGGTDFADMDFSPDAPRFPKFAVPSTTRWQPDISLRQAIYYLGVDSTWRYEYGQNDTENTTTALTIALYANKITAWGREHPGEGDHFEIRQDFWRNVEATVENDYVFSNSHQIGAYDIQLCQTQIELVWPPKKKA